MRIQIQPLRDYEKWGSSKPAVSNLLIGLGALYEPAQFTRKLQLHGNPGHPIKGIGVKAKSHRELWLESGCSFLFLVPIEQSLFFFLTIP